MNLARHKVSVMHASDIRSTTCTVSRMEYDVKENQKMTKLEHEASPTHEAFHQCILSVYVIP